MPSFTTLFDPNFDHHHTIALLIRNTYRVIHIKGLKIIAYSPKKKKSERLPEPTGGSPDFVHLIKCDSLVFSRLSKVYTVLEAKDTDY